MQSRLEKDAADQKRRAERKRRHLIDDLRYGMKKADPSIDLDGTYEDVSDLIISGSCSILMANPLR
jgi:pre-mRNA-processing factor 40